MRLRTANEISLRRLEQLQAPTTAGPNTFVWKAIEYPCAETRERVGLSAGFGGLDEVITKSLLVRAEVFGAAPPPAAGHLITIPHLNNKVFRVLAPTLSADGSHWSLELGEPENQ